MTNPSDLGPLPKCLSCWSGTDEHVPECKTLRPKPADLTDEDLAMLERTFREGWAGVATDDQADVLRLIAEVRRRRSARK